MNALTAKQKIYALAALWLALCAGMYFYFFNILDSKNQELAFGIVGQNKERMMLEAEQESFKQAKADLAMLDQQPVSPNDFFSQDVTLVNEIKALEAAAEQYGVTLTINNLSGTVKTATKAKTLNDMVYVSATLSIKGSLTGIVQYMEYVENAKFIANVSNMNITAADENKTSAALDIQFYLKK